MDDLNLQNDDYAKEAKERWGHTEQYKQSMERIEKLTKDDLQRLSKETDVLLREIVAKMVSGAANPEVQALIAKHYANLRAFYEPNITLYRGLADMYVADDRFAAFYKKYHPDLPQFMHDAMIVFCDASDQSSR